MRACEMPGAQCPGGLESVLPLRELEALAGAGLSVLLALLHPRVAGEEAFLAQRGAQRLVDLDEGAGDAEANRAGLARQPAAQRGRVDVIARGGVRQDER